MRYFDFEGQQLSRVFKGNWQLAGGHGVISPTQAIDDLFAYAHHGVNVLDVGDIYTGAEELAGKFLRLYRRRHGKAAASNIRVHTKFVPDLNALADLTKSDIRRIIERSLQRLGLPSLHLVQFHWWDFSKGNFVEAGMHLDSLRREGLIEAIGLTNFDRLHTKQLLAADIPIRSNQVQFSLLDPRPFNGVLELGRAENIAIFCYGVLAGGLLAQSRPGDEPSNRSHVKYQLVIEEVGHKHYQKILVKLTQLARKHYTTPANIATAFVLQTKGVSAAILGPRNAAHITELDQLDDIALSPREYGELHALATRSISSNQEDIYSYERDTSGPHGRIMKYNLNGMRPV